MSFCRRNCSKCREILPVSAESHTSAFTARNDTNRVARIDSTHAVRVINDRRRALSVPGRVSIHPAQESLLQASVLALFEIPHTGEHALLLRGTAGVRVAGRGASVASGNGTARGCGSTFAGGSWGTAAWSGRSTLGRCAAARSRRRGTLDWCRRCAATWSGRSTTCRRRGSARIARTRRNGTLRRRDAITRSGTARSTMIAAMRTKPSLGRNKNQRQQGSERPANHVSGSGDPKCSVATGGNSPRRGAARHSPAHP